MRYTLVDAFAGAGGLTQGFVQTQRFDPIAAFENNEDARQTYALNFHHGDISKVFPDAAAPNFDLLPVEPDVLIGGPPCQDFTQLAAVRQDQTRGRNDLLWHAYLELVIKLKPWVFLIENVPNLLTDEGYEPHRRELVEKLEAEGYRMSWGILNAAQFGVPQTRQRAFVLGTRIPGATPTLPFPLLRTHSTWEAIGDLPLIPPLEIEAGKRVRSGAELHVGRRPEVLSRLRYRYVLPAGNRMHLPSPITIRTWSGRTGGTADGYGRLHPYRPSPTIRCEAYKPEKGRYLHPFEQRSLTLLEMARLQTFPPDFRFFGSYSSTARQIGNAVPVRLAQALAEAVLSLLDRRPLVGTWSDDVMTLEQLGPELPRTLRGLLTMHVGRPVAWDAIEAVVKKEKHAQTVDWGSALLQLSEAGYTIEDASTDHIPVGTYRLTQKKAQPIFFRAPAERLKQAELLTRGCCDRCGGDSSLVAEFVRVPKTAKDLTPGNVTVLCTGCIQSVGLTDPSPIEERVYEFLRRYRSYEPVAIAVWEAIGERPVRLEPGEHPSEFDSIKTLTVHVRTEAKACALCDIPSPDLAVELIRPVDRGGLLVTENAWALCRECQTELDRQQIKVNAPPGEVQKKGMMVPLRSRFGESGFLTLSEARVRNWLVLNRQNESIVRRATKALLVKD